MPEITAESVSLLRALQTLAGAALAVNLAYLNLENFRYRKIIREAARDCLKTVRADKKHVPSREQADYFRELQYLSALPDNDGAGNKGADKKNADKKVRPKGSWARLYAWGYSWHQDKGVCCFAVAVSVLVLIVGSGHSAGLLDFIEPLFKSEWIGLTFWLLLAVFTVSPMVFVMTAGFCVVPRARRHIEYNRVQLEILAQGDVGESEAEYSQP